MSSSGETPGQTPGLPLLDACGCCEGVRVLTPASLENAPGLSALVYRIGTHSSFKITMQAALSQQPALSGLTTREDDDPSMALLDAWATVADVLTFYQERIANEGYLRTATERRSVLELARAIGYELSPGVAASTVLAFTVEDAPSQLAAATAAQTTSAQAGRSVEDDASAPGTVAVPKGTRVQSIPAQGKLPQTFETIEEIQARAEWNNLRPRLTQPQKLVVEGNTLKLAGVDGAKIDALQVYLQGTSTNLKTGDLLLVVAGGSAGAPQTLPVVVRGVVVEAEMKRTRVDLAAKAQGAPPGGPSLPPFSPPLLPVADGPVGVQPLPLPLSDANINTYILQRRWLEADLNAFLSAQRWNARRVAKAVQSSRVSTATPVAEIYAFRERLRFFGHNAPRHDSLPLQGSVLRGEPFPNDWDEGSGWEIWKDPNKTGGLRRRASTSSGVAALTSVDDGDGGDAFAFASDAAIETGTSAARVAAGAADPYWDDADVYLERAVDGLAGNTWAVFELPTAQYDVYRVSSTSETSLAAFSLSGKATGLKLNNAAGAPPTKKSGLTVRKTTAYIQSERMELAGLPIAEPLARGSANLMLDRLVPGLQVGRQMLLSGERADLPGVTSSELVTLSAIVHDRGFTTLYFLRGLQFAYLRTTVTLNANVARATHGETTREALGSGDGAQANQRFVLKKAPLTYVSASTPRGGKSTLEVRVDGVLWQEAASLYGLAPDSQNYTVRLGDDGKVTVIFGDGRSGARLPSGQENVVGTYRSGIGPDGEVSAGSLTLLQTRPLGVRGVTNPLAAGGAEAPEKLDNARANAPLTVLTLDRIVSLRDFEDFARAFSGIGKAHAEVLWNGQIRLVHITIAAASGDPVDRTSDLYKNLRTAMDAARDPLQPVEVQSFRPRTFSLEAALLIDPRFVPADVLAQAGSALRSAFAFDRRSFGQPVTAAEIVAIVQAVKGVVAVELETLALDGAAPASQQPASVLPADTAHAGLGAELLLVNPSGIKLKEMAA